MIDHVAASLVNHQCQLDYLFHRDPSTKHDSGYLMKIRGFRPALNGKEYGFSLDPLRFFRRSAGSIAHSASMSTSTSKFKAIRTTRSSRRRLPRFQKRYETIRRSAPQANSDLSRSLGCRIGPAGPVSTSRRKPAASSGGTGLM